MNVPDIPERATQTVYGGIWKFLSRVFQVPETPPELPRHDDEFYLAIKPARGLLKYLRFRLGWGLVAGFIFLVMGTGGLIAAEPITGLLGVPLVVFLECLAGVVGFVAIQLRYDTTWYVLNERSMRLRRGIFVIKETTITFENIQNVSIKQGPLQRWFKISTILVETAGGGGKKAESSETASHSGFMEGVEDADGIRDLIMARMAQSRRTGLGDDEPLADAPHTGVRRGSSSNLPFDSRHQERLMEIRDLLCRL